MVWAAFTGPVVGHGRRHKRANPHRHDDEIRMIEFARIDRVIHLGKDRLVPFDHLGRNRLIALPRCVGHDHTSIACFYASPRDGVVIVTVNNGHGGAFAFHRGNACICHSRRHKYSGFEAEQSGHERDSAAMISVGRRRQGKRFQVRQVRGQFVDVGPRLRLGAKVGTNGLIGGPGGAENLE